MILEVFVNVCISVYSVFITSIFFSFFLNIKLRIKIRPLENTTRIHVGT